MDNLSRRRERRGSESLTRAWIGRHEGDGRLGPSLHPVLMRERLNEHDCSGRKPVRFVGERGMKDSGHGYEPGEPTPARRRKIENLLLGSRVGTAWGARGRQFKSAHPDQSFAVIASPPWLLVHPSACS